MNKEETLKKYRDIFEQAVFMAQRARSVGAEMDDNVPETGLMMGRALKMLDPKLYDDENALNIVRGLNVILGKFKDGTVTTSDIQNGISLIHRSPIMETSFGFYAALFDWAQQELPGVLDAARECLKAGIEL